MIAVVLLTLAFAMLAVVLNDMPDQVPVQAQRTCDCPACYPADVPRL
jgi:hypothetical protein